LKKSRFQYKYPCIRLGTGGYDTNRVLFLRHCYSFFM